MKFLIISLLFCSVVFSQEETEPQYEMKTYYMVFLYKGPNRDQDSVEVQRLQKGHMDNMSRLAKEKKLVIAGPFLHDGDLRGIFIFDVATQEEVEELCKSDPAIIAGRLRYEVYPWMSARGSTLP
jgi:uncharacterized protein YciI